MIPALRQRLAEGLVSGTFVNLDSAAAVEIMGAAGFDFLVIDAEHSPFSIERIADLLRAAAAVGVPAMVRVPEVGPYVGRVLDAGAAGILAPRIELAAEAAAVVARSRYAPDGFRGLGPGRGGYAGGDISVQIANANAGVLVAVQIETRAGLENVDEILAVPGLDAVLVGPADLAASLGVPIGSPSHREAADLVVSRAVAAGVAGGAFTPDVDGARHHVANGATFMVVDGDGFLLARAAAASVEALRSLR